MEKKVVFVLIVLLSIPVFSTGGVLTQRVEFSKADLSFSSTDSYSLIRIAGCDLTHQVGEPQLPVKLVHLCLPAGSRVTEVEVVNFRKEEISGAWLVYPTQPPQILPMPGVDIKSKPFVKPKASIYSSSESYPQRLIEFTGSGNMGGYRIASFLLYPLQYIPGEGKLLFHPDIEFRVEFKDGPPSPWRTSKASGEAVKSLVLNPGDVKPLGGLPPGDWEYVIITSSTYQASFQPLADWKTKKGVPARVVTTDSIYANCPGRDNAERVRNFIKDAHLNWGTQWVLLGGDTDVVPDRIAYAMTSEAGLYPDEDSLRADLYYSDLDRTWDENSNNTFGEVADSVDLYPDLFVGRASVNTLTEVQTFVNKVLTYEKNPPLDYQLNMLFLAEILWSDPYTDSRIAKDRIDSLCVPPRFDPITKLYESLGNENRTTVINALNAGQNMTNHNGHANYTVMGIGDGFLLRSDMDALVNGNRQGFLYSVGCWPAAFDYNCIAEHWVNNPNGGGVAFIGNSRYGWGSPGNPAFGYSDRFDYTFYDKLFLGDIYHIGAALALDKAHYIPKSRQANVYRWHQYQLNLLGEPELSVWTETPGNLLVSFPDSIPIGTVSLTVTVRDGDEPVQGALVCLMKDTEVYTFDHTGLNGQVTLEVSPSSAGQLFVTATAHDYLPYEGSSWVFPTGPYVSYLNHSITGGNGDDEVNPGESLGMPITLKNFGNQNTSGVTAILRTDDTLVTVTDSLQSFGNLTPGDTAVSSGQYGFSVSPDAQNGHIIYFTLHIEDGSANHWESILGIPVATPILQFSNYGVDDTWGGNGNRIPEPGESFTLFLLIENTGLGIARDVSGDLATADPYLTVIGDMWGFGTIPPGSTGLGACSLAADGACPTPHFPYLTLETTTSDGYAFTDSIVFPIGLTGFSDDVESGPGGWTHGGSGDMWHITDHRYHSDSHSWYCGNDTTWTYQNNMGCWLMTPPIVPAPNSTLSFWVWYEVTIYGVDGLYVEVVRPGGADTLDFIGSGGALDPPDLQIGNPWLEEIYDLSYLANGEVVQVRFSFVSDGVDVAEGVYLDDISITGVPLGAEEASYPVSPKGILFLPLRPNPFSRETEIRYALPEEGEVELKVYDLGGRLVRTLVDHRARAGYHSVVWGGEDKEGKDVGSGVYFFLLKAGGSTWVRKALLVR